MTLKLICQLLCKTSWPQAAGPLFAAELTPLPTFCWFCGKSLSFEATIIRKASLFIKLLLFEN